MMPAQMLIPLEVSAHEASYRLQMFKEISFLYRVIGNPKLLYGDFNEYYSAVKRIEGKEDKSKCKF